MIEVLSAQVILPKFNFKVGSANQVFTRVLTDNFFEKHYSLEKFAVNGNIMLLFDIQALERMPYSYDKDVGGLRNRNYKQMFHIAQKQSMKIFFNGNKIIKKRKSLIDLIDTLKKRPLPTSETMFNSSLGAKYIKRIIVWTEKDKIDIMHQLEKMGIVNVGGLCLDEAIIVSDHLHENMLWHKKKLKS